MLELLELALADVGVRVRAQAGLDERRDGLDAGRPRQLADLGELLLGIGSLGQDGDDEPALRFRPRGGIGLAWVTSRRIPRDRDQTRGRPEQAAPCPQVAVAVYPCS